MALLTPIKPVTAGTVFSTTAAAASQTFANTGKEYFYVKNGSGGSITVTFDAPNADNWGIVNDVHDQPVTVAAGVEKVVGPFDPARFNDASGQVAVAYSATTSVNVAVLQLY